MQFVKSLLIVIAMVATAAAGAVAQPAAGVERSPGGGYHKRVCGTPSAGAAAACQSLVETDAAGTPREFAFSPRDATTLGALPYYARDLWSAYYGTTARPPVPAGAVAPSTTPTIAVVAAYGYDFASLDLATYRRMNNLPPLCSRTLTTGCVRFQRLNQNGIAGNYPFYNENWALEQALDIQMVSALCPWCNIVLVEANSANYTQLAVAHVTAGNQPRVIAISNSYGGPEQGSVPFAGYFSPSNTIVNGYRGKLKPSIAVLASTGDGGYAGGNAFPATTPFVLAAGGTRLTRVAGRWTEEAWSRGGSACSKFYSQMAWQAPVLPSRVCTTRVSSDVSAVADPETGVAVYFNGRILRIGGTSVSAPVLAGIIGQRNTPISLTLKPGTGTVSNVKFPTPGGGSVATFYGKNLYANRGALRDITTGSNGVCSSYLCKAGVGYDAPTGVGAPNGSLTPF